MRLVLIVVSLLFSGIALAGDTTVTDSKQLLAQVDAFLGSRSFEMALPCGGVARFYAPVTKAELECGEGEMGPWCQASYQTHTSAEGNSEVANCSAEGVSLYMDNGQILDISKADFESRSGNVSRLFLENLSTLLYHPGDVTIDSLTLAEYTLASGEKKPAMHINGQFRLYGAKKTFALLITVVKDVPAVAQVARLRLEEQTWFRLKEYHP